MPPLSANTPRVSSVQILTSGRAMAGFRAWIRVILARLPGAAEQLSGPVATPHQGHVSATEKLPT
jgi:hypothetical protein